MMEKELFNMYQNTGDIALRNEIVEKYLYMVDILIRKYLNKGVEYDDLYQVGAMALVSAVERYKPEKGFEFSSFATPTILGEIRKYFRDKEWTLKVPRRHKEIAAKIPKAKEELSEKLGRIPTPTEIAVHLAIPVDDILHAMESSKAYETKSLNQTYSELGEEGGNAFLEKFTAIEDTGYKSIELAEVIKNALNVMDESEKKIFRKRFIENMTQSEIAKELGVSQMTVSRTEKNIRGKFAKELQRQ